MIFKSLSFAILSIFLFKPSVYDKSLQGVQAQTDSIYAPGTKPVQVGNGYKFTEGPAVDREGNVFFTDQPNDKIWKYGVDGTLTVFMDKTGRSNGMYFDNKGNLISCADEKNEIWSISPDKKVKVLLANFNGKLFNGPNDLWVHPKGGIYFTDPLYKRPWWNESMVHDLHQNVYYLPKGKSQPVVVDAELEQPNGIIGTPDGKYLYVADIRGNKTYRYEVAKDGKLTNKTLYVNQGSDGMTIDNRGNIYLTGKGVTVYNPKGEKIAHINVPANWTANVTFGGRDRSKLFITAMDGVYVMDMLVKGV